MSRDLVVGLRSIKFSDSNTSGEELLSTPILTFIDSTVPHIYLPVSACLAFEKAFGLQYDNDTGLYLVNDTLHEKLVAQNASFIFTLGDQVSGGQTQDIILPYASFDLEASYENLSKSSKYFPLRRAVNDSQYTLGRTFLQETYVPFSCYKPVGIFPFKLIINRNRYLIVDYERANFSVAQALFIENAEQKLIPILSLNDTSQNITITKNNPSSNPSTGSHKISPGAIAGLAVAILIALILIFGAVYFLIRRRQREREKRAADEAYDPTAKPELDGEAKPPIGELYNPVSEADSREASKIGLEMEGSKPASTTLDARERRLAEIEGTHGGAEMEGSRGGAEMENGGHPAAVELDAGPVFPSELPNPDAGTSTLSSPMGPSRLPSPGLRDKPMLSPDSRTAQPPDPSTRGSQPLPSPQGREELSLSPAASSVPGTREPRPPPSDGDAKPVSWGQRWSFKRRRRDGT